MSEQEPNICPHCAEEKPTPHVLVLADDPYCEECWDELVRASFEMIPIQAAHKGEGPTH